MQSALNTTNDTTMVSNRAHAAAYHGDAYPVKRQKVDEIDFDDQEFDQPEPVPLAKD